MENTLGLKIRKVREIKNIGQQYMADQLAISQSAYSDIENCKTKITELRLDQIANVLEVDPEVIKNFSDTVVFNSCTQSGYMNTNNINPINIIEALYQQLLIEKDAQINTLKEALNILKQQR